MDLGMQLDTMQEENGGTGTEPVPVVPGGSC